MFLRLQLVDLSLNCNTSKLMITYHFERTELLKKANAIDIPSYDRLSIKKLTKHLGS